MNVCDMLLAVVNGAEDSMLLLPFTSTLWQFIAARTYLDFNTFKCQNYGTNCIMKGAQIKKIEKIKSRQIFVYML